LRKLKGWTQDELAAKLRVEQTAVSLIENGRSNPTLQTLEAIAACLDVSHQQGVEKGYCVCAYAHLFDAHG
jgi:transcriptional regulator with XRE-family HTH domain